jgi:membrane associated rhomboid family serine protease
MASKNSIKQWVSNNIITLIFACIYFILFIVNIGIGNNRVFNALSGRGFHKLDGQIYRVYTASVLHVGWLHVTSNIIALICVGNFLEKRLGHLRFLATFLISDIFASLMFYGYFSDCTNGNGSSIAIYALFAILLILWLRYSNDFLYRWYHPALVYILIYFVVASVLSGNYTTIIIHSFSFFAGLVIGLLGMKLKLIYNNDNKPEYVDVTNS